LIRHDRAGETLDVPRVADLPICQQTLAAFAPLMRMT